MIRRALALITLVLLAACATPPPPLGPDGKPLPQVYRIQEGDQSRIQFRMLDGVNALRSAAGVQQVAFSAELNAAAATHSQDMSFQNRPWHFGSDGSNPIGRAATSGYVGRLLGENISETYETELETLAAWMEQPETRGVLLDPRAGELGFAWFQEPSGKIWWTLVLGENQPLLLVN
ncbi:MAG: CAP domain-containing protein [Boseongicola sp.]|nr:MAG: CAP domain-containing protein [Boseongicola sp.]